MRCGRSPPTYTRRPYEEALPATPRGTAGRQGRSDGDRRRRDRPSAGAKAPPHPRSGDPRGGRRGPARGRRPRPAHAQTRRRPLRDADVGVHGRPRDALRRSRAPPQPRSTPATRSRSTRGSAAGRLPGARLQTWLAGRRHAAALDRFLTVTHWLWFFEPYAVLFWILVRHPERFPRAARQMAAVFDAGAFGYWAVPTAPPWWASEQGLTEEPVRRIMFEVGEPLWGRSGARSTRRSAATLGRRCPRSTSPPRSRAPSR